MNEFGELFGSVAVLCIGGVVLIVAIWWVILPFTLMQKLKEQIKAANAASARADAALAAVAQNTKQTAEACAALTQWAERSLTPRPEQAQDERTEA